MKSVMCWTVVLAMAPAAWAQPTPTPVDEKGNKPAAASTPRAFPNQSVQEFVPTWQGFGPRGANSKSVAASPTASGVRIAGISDSFGGGALYVSNDNGGFWQPASEIGGRGVNEVQFAVNGHAYAATQDGLFKSTDNGATWSSVTLPGSPNQVLVQSVVTDPSNAQIVWVGLGQFFGGTSAELVLRSTDGGSSWNNVSPSVVEGYGVSAMGIDPSNPSNVFAAFTGNFAFGRQVWQTSDGGATWTDRSDGLPENVIWSFAFSGGTVFASGGQDFGNQFVGVYKSTNNGASWTEVSDPSWPNLSVTAVAVDPANPQRIFAGTQRAGMGVSTNGGASWTFNAGGTGSFAVNDIAFVPGNPNQVFLAMGSIAMLRSTNGGTSFQTSASGINRLNVTSIAVNPVNENEIAMAYAGDNDGGIFTSTDGGETWVLDTNAPLPRWQFLTYSPEGMLYGTHDGPLGRGDDGVWTRGENGQWSNLGPGTVGTLDTQGKTISVGPGSNPTILFGGQDGFFGGFDAVINVYNRNGDGQWEKAYESGAIQSELITGFAWVDASTIVASMVNFGFENGGQGGVFRSTDGGASWSRSETGYPFGYHAWNVQNRASEPGTLYIPASFYTFSDMLNRIYKSTDGGVSWSDASQTDTPPFRVTLLDPLLDDVMYGANLNNGNPMISENDGGTFSLFNQGLLGQGGGASFAYSGASRKLYYGTSSGAFVTPLEPAGCPADFNGDAFVDFFDYLDYVTCFEDVVCPSGRTADFNGDDFVDFFDYSDYVTAFETGC